MKTDSERINLFIPYTILFFGASATEDAEMSLHHSKASDMRLS